MTSINSRHLVDVEIDRTWDVPLHAVATEREWIEPS